MFRKIKKALKIVFSGPFLINALKNGSAAGIEHLEALKIAQPVLLIDVGANKGQFSLAAVHLFPNIKVMAFEPLLKEAAVFKRVLNCRNLLSLETCALGINETRQKFFVSQRADSSFFFPLGLCRMIISTVRLFPEVEVPVRLWTNLEKLYDAIVPFLKLDVQGGELDVIRGAEQSLNFIDYIYAEISFKEFYDGQPLAGKIISTLNSLGFELVAYIMCRVGAAKISS